MDQDHSSHKIFDSLRQQQIRRSESQWLGGVAAGIAQRLQVDAVLVRGVAVALALLGGVGLIAYGLAWAFLPDENDQIHVEQALQKNWTSGMTGALVTFLLGVGPAPWAFSSIAPFVWPLLIVAGVLFVVFSRNNTKFARGPRPTDTAAPTYPADASGHTGSTAVVLHDPEVSWQDPAPSANPVDDTVRAEQDLPRQPGPQNIFGRSASDAPPRSRFNIKEPTMESDSGHYYPGTQPPSGQDEYPGKDYYIGKESKGKQKIPLAPPIPGWVATIIVGATALIIAVVFGLDYLGLVDFPGGSWPLALSLGLLFVGLALVIAALAHRTSGGLLGLAIPLLVLTLIFGNSGAVSSSGFGTSSGGVITSDSDGEYNAIFSNATIDLRQYADITSPTTVEVNTVFASVNLRLPEEVPVRIQSDGIFLSQHGSGAPGSSDSSKPLLIVDVNGAFSKINALPSDSSTVTTPDF